MDVASLPIEMDAGTNARAWNAAAAVARRHGLTLSDAAYVDLAARRAMPQASIDGALVRAALAEAVALSA